MLILFRRLTLLVLTFVSLTISFPTFAKTKINVHFSEMSNFTYQLDCVSRVSNICSLGPYGDLWNQKIIKSNEDEELLSQWRSLSLMYDRQTSLKNLDPAILSGPKLGPKLSTKIKFAGHQATSLADYSKRLELLMLPDHKIQAMKIVTHFYPRFQILWKEVNNSNSRSFVNKMNVLLKNHKIQTRLDQFIHFYQANLSDDLAIEMYFEYRPQSKTSSSGQNYENYSAIEFSKDEKPEDRVDVLIHELCHFLLEISNPTSFLEFEKKFLSLKSTAALGARNLLDESLATVFGNVMISQIVLPNQKFSKLMAHPVGFYNNKHINGSAVALLPLLDKHLANKGTIYSENFLNDYVSVMSIRWAGELESPAIQLMRVSIVIDSDIASDIPRVIRQYFKVSSSGNRKSDWDGETKDKLWEYDNDKTGMIVVTKENFSEFKKSPFLSSTDLSAIEKGLRKSTSVIFGTVRDQAIPVYVVVTDKEKQIDSALKYLASMTTKFSGVVSCGPATFSCE
jgi:hypothetical protein